MVLAAFVLCACDSGEKDLKAAQEAEGRADYEQAIQLYEQICREHKDGDPCKDAKVKIDDARVKAAEQAIQGLAFSRAKSLCDDVLRGSNLRARQAAERVLTSKDMTAGLKWQAAEGSDKRRILAVAEELESEPTVVTPRVNEWLQQNRPALLLQDAKAACGPSPTDACGKTAQRLIEKHPSAKEAKDAKDLLARYESNLSQRAAVLEYQRDWEQAAKQWDLICERIQSACDRARPKADAARMRLVRLRMSSDVLKFAEAKKLLETIKESGAEQGRREASELLDSAALQHGLAYEAAAAKDRRAALPEMEALVGFSDVAGVAAKAWVDRVTPALLLEDAHAECEPLTADGCGRKARELVNRYPASAQAVEARRLVAGSVQALSDAAKALASDGRFLDAATTYDHVCDRAGPPDCPRARKSARETRLQAAQAAMARRRYTEAQPILNELAGSDDAKTAAAARKLLEDEGFRRAAADDTAQRALADAREKCARRDDACPAACDAVISASPNGSEAAEARSLQAAFAASTRSDPEKLIAECKANHESRARLDTCFPEPFEDYKVAGTHDIGDFIELFSLKVAYGFGANGPPTRTKAAFGLAFCGGLVGAGVGLLRCLWQRRRLLGVVAGALACLLLFVLARSGEARLERGLAAVGITRAPLVPAAKANH